MNIPKQIFKHYFILILCTFGVSVANAQKFDQDYVKWKADQEAKDQKLQQQNHYLGKPSLDSTSSTKTSGRSAKVSLNKATLAELQQLDGIGEKKAQAIIDYRQQNGGFKNIKDLENVKGIGPKFIEKNKKNLSL